MAILFYDSISLDAQEIQDVSLQKLGSDPGPGAGQYQGRIIFTQDSSNPTTKGTLSYFDGTDWINLDGVGAVTSVTIAATGTSTGTPFVISPAGGTGAVTIQPMEYAGGNLVGFVPSGSGGDSSKFLNGSGGWTYPAGGMTSWDLAADGGTTQTVGDGETVDIAGGTKITTAASATRTVTVTHDTTSRTDTSDANSPGFGGNFTAFTSITSDATGHITAGNLRTYTLPTYSDTDTTYTLPVSAGASNDADITLTKGGTGAGSNSTVTFSGTSTGIAVTESAGNNGTITLGLQTNVSITTSLTVGTGATTLAGTLDVTGNTTFGAALSVAGIATFTEIPIIPSTLPTTDTQAANKAYVDDVLTGGVVFQGGYNANADTTDDGDSLDGISGSSIAVSRGWAYAVTTAGDFFTEPVEIGDLLIANEDMTAGNSALAKWSVLQNNVIKATNTDYGIAKFLGANGFESTMSVAGQPKLAAQSVSYTPSASQVPVINTNTFGVVTGITNTPISITANAVSNFTAATKTVVNSLRKAMLIPTGGVSTSPSTITLDHELNNANLSVQVFEVSTGATVYPQIERVDDDSVNITFAQTPATNTFKALIF
tara:strand:- start:2395 stop:4191 length:1797 start_codon:yes stop_codon:yes gene_type:complete